jgi:hypothetical protein
MRTIFIAFVLALAVNPSWAFVMESFFVPRLVTRSFLGTAIDFNHRFKLGFVETRGPYKTRIQLAKKEKEDWLTDIDESGFTQAQRYCLQSEFCKKSLHWYAGQV